LPRGVWRERATIRGKWSRRLLTGPLAPHLAGLDRPLLELLLVMPADGTPCRHASADGQDHAERDDMPKPPRVAVAHRRSPALDSTPVTCSSPFSSTMASKSRTLREEPGWGDIDMFNPTEVVI